MYTRPSQGAVKTLTQSFNIASESALLPSTVASKTSSSTTIPTSLNLPITKKLTKSNYLLWHFQIMPVIRAVRLEGFLEGFEKKPVKMLQHTSGDTVVDEENPAYVVWITRDQSVLGYLLSSLTREVFTGIATMTSPVHV
jgi:hypothetical protein